MNPNAYNIYKNNSVTYSSKEQQLLMLVDGAVRFAKRAKLAIQEKNIQDAHNNIMKTHAIFTELKVTLDTNAGEWAKNLFDVYTFINQRLITANIKKDEQVMDEAIRLIESIRNLWYEAYEASKNQG